VSLLEQKKLQILKQNLRTKFGSVDFLVRDGSTIALVKVYSKSENSNSIIDAIDASTREKLILLLHKLMSTYQTNKARVDLALLDNTSEVPKYKYHSGIIEFNL